MAERIRIKDKRQGVFTLDNVVLDNYGKYMGTTGIALYVALCRFANNQSQSCYPSITKISSQTGMNRNTIISAADKLIRLKLITKKVKIRQWTIYTLLEPEIDKEKKNSIIKSYLDWYEIDTTTGEKAKKEEKSCGTKSIPAGTKSIHKRTKIPNLDTNTVVGTTKDFDFVEYSNQMKTDKNLVNQIISLYWLKKGFTFDNLKQTQAALKRELRPANNLSGYSLDRIEKTMNWCKRNAAEKDYKWTLETVHKYIDERKSTGTLDKYLKPTSINPEYQKIIDEKEMK